MRRGRYRDHLTEVLVEQDVDDAGVVAEIALNALTEWSDTESGELCRPSSDLDNFGFSCSCTRKARPTMRLIW